MSASALDAEGRVLASLDAQRVAFVPDVIEERTFTLRSPCEGLGEGDSCGDCRVCSADVCVAASEGSRCGECEGDTCRDGACRPGAVARQVIAGAGALARDELEDFTCSLVERPDPRADVVCWGSSSEGRLGRMTMDPAPTPTLTHSTRTSGSMLVGSRSSACVLLFGGSRVCWGNNASGSVGPSALGSQVWSPVEIDDPPDLRQLSGGAHVCGIDGSGRLFCWGYNERGQVGPGPNAVRTPQEVTLDDGGGRWLSVEAAGLNTCAIRSSAVPARGSLWCWGYAPNGQLGEGTRGVDRVEQPRRVGCAADGVDCPSCPCFDDWVQAALGEFHACGVRADGSLWCWGGNGQGQLGSGGVSKSALLPVRVSDVGASPTWERVAAGGRTTCALRRDDAGRPQLHCWGAGDEGQLWGSVDRADPGPPLASPWPGYAWEGVDVGVDHVCGILEGGSVWCWGQNDSGQLGLGHADPVAVGPHRACLPLPIP